MIGRPPRTYDTALAKGLRQWMEGEGLSARAAANRLDVSASTVVRALQNEAFSVHFASVVRKVVLPREANSDPALPLQEVLRLLEELGMMRDAVEAAVRLALDRLPATE